MLEVGPATGKVTAPLADRGFRITAVELGPELAQVATERFRSVPNVAIVTDDFDTWIPPLPGVFDLVCAATSWHWLDPVARYQQAAAALRPGGWLAVWATAHVVPVGGDPFFCQIQDVYDEIGAAKPDGRPFPRPGELTGLNLERDSNGLFERVAARQFDWETRHDADSYIELLDTFSEHLEMQQWQRDRLFAEIRRRLASRPDQLVRRHWGTVLEIARLRTD